MTNASKTNNYSQYQQMLPSSYSRNSAIKNLASNSLQNDNIFDHDKISLSSLLALEDLNKLNQKDLPEGKIINNRSQSAFVRNWVQTSDVPYIIGANITDDHHGLCGEILLALSWLLIVLFFPFSLFVTIKVVQEYERAVIFRLGRLLKGGAKGPGLFIVLPCIESYTKVDMRTVSFDVPPQEVLTKDSVTVAVDAVVYYRVFNPVISIANVENSQESTRLLAQTSLRNVLGTNSLAEILSNREAVSICMREILDEATDKWGIKVERVEIKDVRLPIQLQRAMATEAEATREAKAKVIAAEGEHKASRALKEAADILNESPSAIQLRYLQTLNNIAAEKNSTIVFPIPIDLPLAIGLSSNNTKYRTRAIKSEYENQNRSYNNNNNENKSNNDNETQHQNEKIVSSHNNNATFVAGNQKRNEPPCPKNKNYNPNIVNVKFKMANKRDKESNATEL